MVIERYELKNGDRIDYGYSLSLRNQMSRQAEDALRDAFFEHHLGKSFVYPTLLSIVIPESEFISYCKDAGFEDYIKLIQENKET